MSRQEPELPSPSEAGDERDEVVLGRGVSDLPVTVNELQVVIDGARRDDEFMGLLRTLADRDAEILDRLAVGNVTEEQESPDSSVEVVPYREEWPARFEAESSALAEALPAARTIEHIGSTAVPGLSSKPTIDILMVVDHVEDFLDRLQQVEALGYDYREQNDFVSGEDHLFLRKVVDGKRTCHLHVLGVGSPEIVDYRLFREWLRTDKKLASRYETFKLDLAAKHADDRMRYVAEKEIWVDAALASLRADRSATSPVYDRIGAGTDRPGAMP